MKRVVFWGGGPVEGARALVGEGAALVAWGEASAEALRAAQLPCVSAQLDRDASDAVDEAAIDWTKQWGRRSMLDGRSFRELLAWKGVSLWWFAELYLHHSTASPRRVRLVDTFHRLLEREQPAEVEAFGLAPEEGLLLSRTCTARGILFHGPRRLPAWPYALHTWRVSLESRWNTLKAVASAAKALLAGAWPRPAPGARSVLFLSHAAFWRERRDPETELVLEYEHYLDRLIPGVAETGELSPFVVAVGPRAAFRRRSPSDRVTDWLGPAPASERYVHVNRYCRPGILLAVVRATRAARAAWRLLRSSPGVLEAFSHRGVAFGDLAGPDLAGTLLLQLPWAVRCYEEMAAVLESVRPAVVCLYAESSGWGRAALAACRAAGVPSVAVQHGILYPKYYSYRHAADEAACPLPDRTAVFGEAARRLLVERGGYPSASLVLTGSPKFDDLLLAAARYDRAELRRRFGLSDGERLVIVASRFRGIRETHQSIGSAFPALLGALAALPQVRCLVKPHPAEAADAYQASIRAAGATGVAVVPPGVELLELLHASDALVTVESLAAVEALVVGRPVLILNMPTNMRELVEQGVALGVGFGEDPLPALRGMLFDAATRERLAEARERYLSDHAHGVDGQATARILALIRETALEREHGRV